MLDKGRPAPNFRGLGVRDGRVYLDLDTEENDMDLFVGHPVTANRDEIAVTVAWEQEGKWRIETHNPTALPVAVQFKTNPGWTVFDFERQIDLPAGTSESWTIDAAP
jgi:hypothetical protein